MDREVLNDKEHHDMTGPSCPSLIRLRRQAVHASIVLLAISVIGCTRNVSTKDTAMVRFVSEFETISLESVSELKERQINLGL